jgi:hypothetical protein
MEAFERFDIETLVSLLHADSTTHPYDPRLRE